MLNHIDLMGRLTREPELRKTGSNVAVASFSIAVDRDIPEKITGQRETDFIDCVAWRGTGEFICRNFHKGGMIAVSGRLQIRSWTDKDGNKRKTAEVVVDNAYFAGSRGEGGSAGSNYGGQTYNNAPQSVYPETEAMLRAYGVPPADDYQMLADEDNQLPF